jgi:hypothetical protein
MNFFSASREQYIEFFAGLFDPFKHGMIHSEEYEASIDCLFKDQFSAGIEDEENSLSADVKRTFIKAGIVTNKGDLDAIKLRKGFETGVIDIEVFKQALK